MIVGSAFELWVVPGPPHTHPIKLIFFSQLSMLGSMMLLKGSPVLWSYMVSQYLELGWGGRWGGDTLKF